MTNWKKINRKVLAVFLILAVCLTMAPISAFAAGAAPGEDIPETAAEEAPGAFYEISTAKALQDAIDSASSGDMIVLSQDLLIDACIVIDKTITIDGRGNSITCMSEAVDKIFMIGDKFGGELSNLDVTIKNLNAIDGAGGEDTMCGISVCDCPYLQLVLDNVAVSAEWYALDIAGNCTESSIEIKNSTLTGWCAIKTHASGVNIDVTGSTLTGTNNRPYYADGSNRSGTIVVEGTAADSHVTVSSSSIIAEIADGEHNEQWIVYLKNVGSSVEFTDCAIGARGAYKAIHTDGLGDGATVDLTPENVRVRIAGGTLTVDEKILHSITAGALEPLAKLQNAAVAEVNSEGYTSLQDAIDACPEHGTVVLLKGTLDEPLEESVTVNGAMTLDLNGKTLCNTVRNHTITVGKEGRLTIIGDGTVDNLYRGRAVVYNDGGTVDIAGGTFIRSKDSPANNSSYVIYNNAGSTTISSGRFDRDVTALCAEGYVCYQLGSGSFFVAEKPTITAVPGSLTGGGTVTLAVTKPDGTPDAVITYGSGNAAVNGPVSLPNIDAEYTFTATVGNVTAACTVTVTQQSIDIGAETDDADSTNDNDVTGTDAGTEADTGTDTDRDTETDAGTDKDSDTEMGPSTATDKDAGTETGPGTATDKDTGTETGPGTAADKDTGTETGSGTATDKDTGTETEPGTAADKDTDTETGSGTSMESGMITGPDGGAGTDPDSSYYPSTPDIPGSGGAHDPGNVGTDSPDVSLPDVPLPEPSLPYVDVLTDSWYYGAVAYTYANNLMNGTSDTSFEPETACDRAMMATILYRMEQEPAAAFTGVFPDVEDGQWYTNGIEWCAANEIVGGYDNSLFGPADKVTREQLIVMLYRYAGHKDCDVSAKGDFTAYSDGGSVSDWAMDGMTWAVGAGLIQGSDGMLNPGTYATRAEIAVILQNFCEKFTLEG